MFQDLDKDGVEASRAAPPAAQGPYAAPQSSAAPRERRPWFRDFAHRTRRDWFTWGVFLALIMSCGLALSPNPADPDLWGHVQYGRDVFQEGLPATTTYSFTANGYRWINHENLSELLLAVGADGIGAQGLLIAKMLLGLAILGLMMYRAYRGGAGMLTVCIVSLVVAVNLTYHWAVRPQLVSFTCFTLLLLLLSWSFRGWAGRWRLPGLARKHTADGVKCVLHLPDHDRFRVQQLRRLWLAAPLFFVWANSHGAFVAGLCVFFAYLGCRALEFIMVRGGTASIPALLRMGLAACAALAATLINPYSYRLHAWLVESLGRPRPEITEWQGLTLTSELLWPFILITLLTVAALAWSRRPRDFTHLVILGVTYWQAIEHQRHIAFFALAVGMWLPPHVESVIAWAKRLAEQSRKDAEKKKLAGKPLDVPSGARPLWQRAGLVCGLLLALGLLSYRLYDRLHIMRVELKDHPVSALQYMADNDLTEGRLVVTYNWAQYVIMAFGAAHPDEPGMKVSLDGRFRTCYPQDLVDAHFDFVLGNGPDIQRWRSPDSPPPDSARILEVGNPDLVLLSRGQPHSLKTIREQGDAWTLLYQDSLAELWGRTSQYGAPDSEQYIPPAERDLRGVKQAGQVNWPALPVRSPAS